jgi:transposase
MNYIIGEDRTQIKIESIDSYVNENNEVRVIDKIVDVMDIESLGFNI